MTTPKDPAQIRAEIDQTRSELANDASRLTEKVTPSKIVERKVDGVKGAVSGVKDKVLGSHDSGGLGAHGAMGAAYGGSAADAASSVAGGVSDAFSGAAGAVASAPHAAKSRASGSPVIAGAVAFGVGYLLSSLLPASSKEQQLAGQVKDSAGALKEPVKEALTSAATEVKEQVAPQAADAAAAVKEAGQQAVGAVKETASSAASDVQHSAADAAGTVTGQAADSAATVKEAARDPYPAAGPAGPAETAVLPTPVTPAGSGAATTERPSIDPLASGRGLPPL